MNLLLLEPAEAARPTVVLRDRRARHLREVLRAEVGARLRAGVIGGGAGGPVGEARVMSVTADEVIVRFEATGAAPAVAPVRVVLAVPRPKVVRRVIQAAAAMGVERVELVNAWRVDKSYLGSERLRAEAIAEDVRLGAEQGGMTRVPRVELHPRLMGWFETFSSAGVAICAHARGGQDLERAVPRGFEGEVVIAIGPEGGWIDREVDTFAARGFAIVTLGAPILRVEAAVVAALAQVALLRRLRE